MNKTEKKLIETTFDILYKNGYCATSISDILDSAELTKGSLYYYNNTKNELILNSMDYYLESFLKTHWIELLEKSDTPIETLIKQIEAYKAMFADNNFFLDIKHGSPLCNFVHDMSNKDNEFFIYIESIYKRWQMSVKQALVKAQLLQQTKMEFDANNQALFIISTIKGSIVSARAYNDFEILNNNFNTLIIYIKSL